MKKPTKKPFWELPLDELTKDQWEQLCDGAGRCSLLMIDDEDTAEIEFTNVSCRLFDNETCRCGNYALRKQIVKDCVVLTPENIERIAYWMPQSCAYRLRFDGHELPLWHPLVTGDPDSTHKAGVSMQQRTIPEYEINEDDLEDYITPEIS